MAADPTKSFKCAVYTRKSSEEGLEQAFNSLDAQREACEAYITSQRHEGWSLVSKQYDDGGFSGGNMDRPALTELLNDIKAGKVTVIVVYKVDRLTRSLADFAKLVELFDRHGVSFVSVTQQFNTTTSMGRLTLNVLLSFAQFEREVAGERIRDKIAASKRKGMFMGGGYPLGYDVHDRELVINETEAEQVRTIFALYLELKSVRRLQAEMAKRGYKTKLRVSEAGRTSGGKRFFTGSIYYMLRNRTYIGEIAHKGNIYEGRHKPIIERSVWNDVQALLADNARERAFREWARDPAPFGGFIFDDRGNRLTPTHTQKGGRYRYRYYACRALLTDQPELAGPIRRVPAEEIETLVAGQMHDLCESPSKLAQELERLTVEPDRRRTMIENVQSLAAKLRDQDEKAWIDLGRKIIQKIVVGPTQVEITTDLSKLEVACTLGEEAVESNGRPLIVELVVPVRVTRAGRQKSMVVLDADGSQRLVNENMVLAIARALKWDREVRAGDSLNAIAGREGVSTTYATRIMPLAFLAPDIVEAIYDGRQPSDLKVKALSANLPLDWATQRRTLGFPAR